MYAFKMSQIGLSNKQEHILLKYMPSVFFIWGWNCRAARMRGKRAAPQAGKEHKVECRWGGQAFSRECAGWLVVEDGTSPEGTQDHCVWEDSRREAEGRTWAKRQGAGFLGLLSPFSHWSVCQKSVGGAWASDEGLVWFSLGLRGGKGCSPRPATWGRHRGGCSSVPEPRSTWPGRNWHTCDIFARTW